MNKTINRTKTMIEKEEYINETLAELKKYPEGLTISQLERNTKLPRNGMRLAISHLEGSKKVRIRNVGSSKLIILK